MEQQEITPGVFIEQEQQGPEQFLPNQSVNLSMLGPDVITAIANISDTDLAAGTVIDWSLSNVFFNVIAANKTFTFTNMVNGKTIVVIIKNTSGGAITPTFPTALFSGALPTVASGTENVYTFIRSNSKTYVSVVDGMV